MSDVDLTRKVIDLEAENARLRRLLDHKNVPSALRHQVRNALGLIRAVIRQSAASKTDVDDFVAHVDGRLNALLRTQTALLANPDGRVGFEMLVINELLVFTTGEHDRIAIAGPEVRVEAKQAEALGLVIHELATNALKYGALALPEGRIDVSWTLLANPDRLTITWAERGLCDVSPPTMRGFGMDAIEGMLPYQLRAESTLAFLPEGLHCTIAVPLS